MISQGFVPLLPWEIVFELISKRWFPNHVQAVDLMKYFQCGHVSNRVFTWAILQDNGRVEIVLIVDFIVPPDVFFGDTQDYCCSVYVRIEGELVPRFVGLGRCTSVLRCCKKRSFELGRYCWNCCQLFGLSLWSAIFVDSGHVSLTPLHRVNLFSNDWRFLAVEEAGQEKGWGNADENSVGKPCSTRNRRCNYNWCFIRPFFVVYWR